MFKRRAKAKQSSSGPPVQRPNLSTADESSVNCVNVPQQQRSSDATREKLTIEEVRSRYGGAEGKVVETKSEALQNGEIREDNSQLAAGAETGRDEVRSSRQEIEYTLAEASFEDWEVEQLRKVGVAPSQPVSSNNTLEKVADRLRNRLAELDKRAEILQKQVSDLESTL